MKYSKFILFVVLLSAAGFACRKGSSGGGQSQPYDKVSVSTFAGDGKDAYANGPLLSARFRSPVDVAISSDGIIYVSDYSNHRIRKISGGQVSLLAGIGNWGTTNGAGNVAEFKDPYRIEVDAAGNVYVLDQNNPHVRQITPLGDVSVFAGTDVPGFRNGDAVIAQFALDQGGLAFDAQGNLYIDDSFNGRIRKISLAGQVSTFAGKETEGFVEGDTSVAQFRYPDGILFDKQGNMYVADNGNFCIRKITSAGVVSVFTGARTKGTADGGPGVAQFSYINDMVMDKDGNFLLSDEHRIRKISPAGEVSTLAGSTAGYAEGNGATAKFNYPAGIALDAEGNLFVADALNNRVRKISFK